MYFQGQLPEHFLPQPSDCPQVLPLHDGVQQPLPALHVLPQPSASPHFLPLQTGVHGAQDRLLLQICLITVQFRHPMPPIPHWLSVVPATQGPPRLAQQPVQLCGPQRGRSGTS